MSKFKSDSKIGELKARADGLEEFVDLLSGGLTQPLWCAGEDANWFRYRAPDIRHYCLLQMSSAVGALQAAIHLARGGFWVEVCVLVRIVIEATTHIDWMLHSQDGSEAEKRASAEYLEKYLADTDRVEICSTDPIVKQREVHKVIASNLDQQIRKHGLASKPAAELMHTTYKRFSYYIHNRYPELMDRYDGGLRRFTLSGHRNPQKDSESIGIISTYLDTVTLCALHIAIRYQLMDELKRYPSLSFIANFSAADPRTNNSSS